MPENTDRPVPVRVVYRVRLRDDDRESSTQDNDEQKLAKSNPTTGEHVYHDSHSVVSGHSDFQGDSSTCSTRPTSPLFNNGTAQGETEQISHVIEGVEDSTQRSTQQFDLVHVNPRAVWLETNIDAGEEGDAPVPDDFVVFEEEDEEVEIKANKHKSAPLPEFYSLENVPTDLTKLPPLNYYRLDPSVDPVRLLVILPHFGNPYSTVECNLFPVSLKEEHYCFAAIRNTRGNKQLTSHIIINNCVKQVRRNLEVFLRHFRKEQYAIVVWVRELCIDAGDAPEHQTPIWRDQIFERACKLLDMTDFMYQLQSHGILEKEKQFTVRPKDWFKVAREAKLPTHYPIPLRTFTNEQMKGKESDVPIIPHVYLPLDLVAEEIRLIVLMPSADPDAPIVAHLAHESLYGPAAYHCLSYTWGDSELTEDLILSGQVLKITKNLAGALKAIRPQQPDQRATLWVDAVCINQADIIERSRQVSRMHQIYEMADAVLIWLGDASSETDVAMDFAQQLERSEEVAFDIDADSGAVQLICTKDTAQKWAALYELLLRPYFRRLWIVQELTLASVPTAFCGQKQVSWHNIHKASILLQLHRDQIRDLCDEFGFILSGELPAARADHAGCPNCFQPRLPDMDLTLPHKLTWHREMTRRNLRPSFLYLCLLNRDAECSNPRDKIFALWNLAREADQLSGVQPNYALSIREVYMSFAKEYMRATRSLDIICTPKNYCDLGGDCLDLPSWVPDWRSRSAVNSYIRPDGLPFDDAEKLTVLDKPLYRASGGTVAMVDFDENEDTLTCAGLIVDAIAYVSPNVMKPDSWYQEAKQLCHRDGQTISPDDLNRQFTSMTMGDATCSWEADDSFSRIRWVGADVNAENTVNRQIQIMPGKIVQSPLKARTFVITKKGYMGLAPFWVRPGFELAIILGCSVPVLLERHGNHNHVRGDCFVQGWMSGEILEALGMTDEEVMKHVGKNIPPIVFH